MSTVVMVIERVRSQSIAVANADLLYDLQKDERYALLSLVTTIQRDVWKPQTQTGLGGHPERNH